MMKKILIFIFIFLFQINLFALDTVNEIELAQIWRAGNFYYPFVTDQKTRALISKKCKALGSECLALQAVKQKLQREFSEEEKLGGKNPASLLCTLGFKAKILILKDELSNENSFCQFTDLSIVRALDLR